MMMLSLKPGLRSGDADIATIIGPIEILHEEQEPVLFTGVNRFGAQIIGNFVDEDISSQTRRFVHIQVSKSDYKDFIIGKISYMNLLERAGNVYVVDKSPRPGQSNVLTADNYTAIPEDYLPAGNSMAPPLKMQGGSKYIHTFNGGKANLSGADPKKVAALLKAFPPVLTDPAHDVAPEWQVRADVLAFPEGSFEIAFALRHEIEANLTLFPAEIDYGMYVQRFVDFCMNRFPSEAAFIAGNELHHAPFFLELLDARASARSRLALPAGPGDPLTLVRYVERSASIMEELASLLDADLTSISIFNVADGARSTLGILDRQSGEQYAAALDAIQPYAHTGLEQAPPQDFTITMHALNKDTRRGGARVLLSNSRGRGRKTRVRIAPDLDLEPFTESLHLGTFVAVRAIASQDSSQQITYLDIVSS